MGKHKNSLQDAVLLRFMENHIAIAMGFIKGDKVAVEQLWKELAEELNTHGPPSKDEGWKKESIDWKAIVRKKIAYNNSEGRATCRGPFNRHILTPAEETIGQLCGIFKVVRCFGNTVQFGQPRTNEDEVADGSVNTAANNLLTVSEDEICASAAADFIGSTSGIVATSKRRWESTWNESIKKYMVKQTQTIVSMEEHFKELKENKENLRTVKDLKLHIKDINHTLKKMCETLKNMGEESGRNHFKMEELRKDELDLTRKELELEEEKLNFA